MPLPQSGISRTLRVALLFCAILIAVHSVPVAAQTPLASDSFNRGNGTLSPNWTTLQIADSAPVIVSQQVQSNYNRAQALYYGGINWPADQYAQAQITASNGGSTGPAVRMTSEGYYAGTVGSFGTGNAQVYILLDDASGFSVVASSSTATVLANDYLQLSVQGTTLTLTDVTQSTTLLTVTDSNISAGYPGLYVSDGGTLANWSAGELTTAPLALAALASDNFNRADAPNLGSNWAVGPGYYAIQIINDQIESAGQGQPPGTGHGKEYYTAVSFPSDQWSQGQVIAANGDINGAIVRYQGSVDTHYIGFVSTLGSPGTCTVTIDRDISGAPVVLATDSTYCSVSSGDYVRFQAQGSLLSYIDVTTGTLLLTAIDTEITGGSPGWSLNPVGGMPIAANWSGGGFIGAAVMQTPTSGSTLTGSSVTFTWSSAAGATGYWVDIGTSPGGNTIYQSGNLGTTLTATVNTLPTNGSTVYVTLYTLVGGQWVSNPYAYTAIGGSLSKGVITTPTPGSTLSGSSVTFNWTAGTGATAYWLDVGNVAGGNQYYQSGNLGSVFTITANGLPTDGSTVYVTLYSLVSGQWFSNAYTYTAVGGSASKGAISTPTPGSTLSGSSVTFNWTAGTGATAYWLDVGNVPGGNQYEQSGNLGNVFTTTVNGLPVDGSTVYVTLYSLVSGQWFSNAYTYTAVGGSSSKGVITTPAPGATLPANRVTFDWTAGTAATAYWLDVGNVPGGNQWYQSGSTTALTTTAPNLPADGSMLYATLYSLVGGQWVSNSYTYKAAPGAVMQTPVPGTTLSGASVTFSWSAGTGFTSYEVTAGLTYGGSEYYSSGSITALTTTATGLPTDGSTIYVTLYSVNGGQTVQNYYSYLSGP